jgi:hypothetical protein
MPDIFMGIDPGKSGAIVAMSKEGGILAANTMPETEREICDLFSIASATSIRTHVFIERLQPMPKIMRGVVAAFQLGRSYGFLRGILTALQIPFDDVPPQVWQKSMGCLWPAKTEYKERKAKIRQRAQQLFPKENVTKDLADAFVICEFGRRLFAGQFTQGASA